MNVKHSKKMYKAMRRKDKKVDYMELADGNRYLSNGLNRLQAFRTMNEFLHKHLVQHAPDE